jgi:predicted dehydrogenase
MGQMHCSMWSSRILRIAVQVTGDKGDLYITNPVLPQAYHRLRVRVNGKKRIEKVSKRPTYEYQLEAFCAAVQKGAPVLTAPSDAIANMRVIDAVYRAAGMQPRGTRPNP